MAVRAWPLNPTGTDGNTREDVRIAQNVWMTADTPIKSISGIRSGSSTGTEPFDLQGVSAMQAKITPGLAYIQGTATQGGYAVFSDTDVTLTFSDGNATNPRIDLVYLKVFDDFQDASGQTLATITKIEGTPAAVPTVPTLPATAIPLWRVRVNAGVSAGTGGINSNPGWTAARTDSRWYTVAAGGIVPAGGNWSGVHPGQYRDDGTNLQRWNGSAWKTPYVTGWLGSRESDTGTVSLSGGPWRLNELGTLTLAFSSTRRYKITAEATCKSNSSAPNGGFLDIRYKTGSSIPNDQNPSSSTLLANRHYGFATNLIPIPGTVTKIFEPSVTETGTVGVFWSHNGSGNSIVEGDMVLIVEDIGPR
jgi:hypothetical protein